MLPTAPRSSYFPLDGIVRNVVSSSGRDDWEVRSDDFWTHVRGPVANEREQGWKLHVSATPLSAPIVLHRVAEVLVAGSCEFKFAGSLERVEELTGIRFDRAQAGKFVTAYPRDDEHLRELAAELDRVTQGLQGPRILSDRPLHPGSLVHLRYGAIQGVPTLTNDGMFEARIRTPDGDVVPDLRKAWFTPPPWAEAAPVPEPDRAARRGPREARPVLLGGRFLVEEAIRHSARGGVYRAVDQRDGSPVIVKQARPHIGSGLSGLDARDALRAEAVLLDELAPLTPARVDVFEADDNVFLVESAVPGETLASWIHDRFSRIDGVGPGPEAADALDLARQLTAVVTEIHRRGLVLRDLTSANVMVTPDRELRLIDPELVTEPGRPTARSYTPGFVAPEVLAGPSWGPAPGPEADLFSLGCVLMHLVTGTPATLAADSPSPRADRDRVAVTLRVAAGSIDAASRLSPAILGLMDPVPATRWTPARLGTFLDAPPAPAPVGPVDADTIDRLVDDGLDHIIATLDPDAARLWPSDGFGSGTDVCNVQYGAAGVLNLLTRAAGVLDRPGLHDAVRTVATWIDDRRDAAPRLLPGLYFGRAGTAWALFDAAIHLDDPVLAEHAAHLAAALPVRWPNPDVCHGATGAGMTQLHLWRATGRREFLARAEDCADGLLAAAERTFDHDGRNIVLWPIPATFDSELAGARHLGFAHGVAGVGTFLLAVGEATGRADLLAVARTAGDTLVAAADRGPGGARWRADHRRVEKTEMYYHWCSGSSGVGTFLIRLADRFGTAGGYQELASEAACAVHTTRWIAPTAACHGLAGNGDFLLDMAERDAAGDTTHHNAAVDVATLLSARHALVDGRMLLPDESGTTVTVNHGTGLAGAVGFLLRLRHGGPRAWMADGRRA